MTIFTSNIWPRASIQRLQEAATLDLAASSPSSSEKGKHLKTRVKEALYQTGKTDLLARITGCGRGQLCSSVYCKECHRRLAQRFEAKIWDYVKSANLDEPQIRSRFRYATVICEVTEMTPRSVQKAVDRARRNMKAVHRSYPDIWYHGAFDFELIRPELLGEHKSETIKHMAEIGLSVPQRAGETYVLVHFHALIDTAELSNAVGSRINLKFGQAPRQARLDRLYKDQTLDESFAKISNYAYKHEWRFKGSFNPKELEIPSYIEPHQLSFLISLYDDIKGDNNRGLIINGKPTKERPIDNNDIEWIDNDQFNVSSILCRH